MSLKPVSLRPTETLSQEKSNSLEVSTKQGAHSLRHKSRLEREEPHLCRSVLRREAFRRIAASVEVLIPSLWSPSGENPLALLAFPTRSELAVCCVSPVFNAAPVPLTRCPCAFTSTIFTFLFSKILVLQGTRRLLDPSTSSKITSLDPSVRYVTQHILRV